MKVQGTYKHSMPTTAENYCIIFFKHNTLGHNTTDEWLWKQQGHRVYHANRRPPRWPCAQGAPGQLHHPPVTIWMGQMIQTHKHKMHLDTYTHTHTDFRYMHTLRGEMVSTCAVNQPPELSEHEGGRLESREKRFVSFSTNCLHKNIFIRNIGEYSARESITFPEVTYNFCYSFTLTVVKTLFKQYYWKHHQRISHKKEK